MCVGCINVAKEQQEQFSSLHAKAKALAIKTGENVLIYKTETGLDFMVESVAVLTGAARTVVQYVSPLQPADAG